MALEESGTGMVMPVQPMYNGGWGGGYGYPVPVYGGGYGNNNGLFGGGGDLGALLVLFLFGALFGGGGFGGFGMGGWGGLGGMMGGANLMMWPWLMTTQTDNLVTGGFNNSAVQGQLSGIQSGMTSGFSDVQLGISGLGRQICETGSNITAAVTGAASAAEIAANGRHSALTQQLYGNEINALNRSFAEQTANQQGFTAAQKQLSDCCCENRLATCQTQNLITREAAETRAAQTADTQKILDKLCQLELDGVRQNYEARIAALQNLLDNSRAENQSLRFAASQTGQTAQILAGQAAEIDGVYNRLKNCPVGTYSVCNPLTPAGYNCGSCGGYRAAA